MSYRLQETENLSNALSLTSALLNHLFDLIASTSRLHLLEKPHTKMKKIALTLLAAATTGSLLNAAPFLAIGDGAELFVTGTLGIRADDNIYTVEKATSDTIFDINPGLEITFGKDAALKGSLTLVDSFSNYSDNSKLNTNLFTGDLRANFEEGKLKLNFNTGFHEMNQNTPTLSGLTRRDQFVIGTGAEIEISAITALGADVKFTHDNFKVKGYADTDELSVPLKMYYKWTEKVDLSFGYSYRSYETTIGLDSTDHFFNVGARGQFTPKLAGKFSAGVATRKFDLRNSETLPGFDAKLTYALTEKTSIDAGSSYDFGTSPQGVQQKNFSLNGGININLDEQWTVNGGLSLRSVDYYTRTDDYVEGILGAGYVVNTYVKISASYTYRNNNSPLAGGSFTQNVFSISTNFRY